LIEKCIKIPISIIANVNGRDCQTIVVTFEKKMRDRIEKMSKTFFKCSNRERDKERKKEKKV
jgi:hypothetical protein